MRPNLDALLQRIDDDLAYERLAPLKLSSQITLSGDQLGGWHPPLETVLRVEREELEHQEFVAQLGLPEHDAPRTAAHPSPQTWLGRFVARLWRNR